MGSNTNTPAVPQRITIGAKASDADLIKKIINYQKATGLPSGADAVRVLCEDALNLKKALR